MALFRYSSYVWATQDDGRYKPSLYCLPAGLTVGLIAGGLLMGSLGLLVTVPVAWAVTVASWLFLEWHRRLLWKREAPHRAVLMALIDQANEEYNEREQHTGDHGGNHA